MSRFDIIVPTYQRYHELPVFFAKNAALRYEDAQVWIIDDCSPYFDATVIPSWPNLTLIRMDQNRGQAFARNVALQKGCAPYVISLDDDAWFENGSEALRSIEYYFDKFKDSGCLMFNIATPSSSYSALSTGTVLALHVTCGCAYRRDTLSTIRHFSGFLHSGAEETDMSLRIYQAGWTIRFLQEVKVFHNFNVKLRSLQWYLNVRHNTTRNELLIVLMRYPARMVPVYVLGKWINHLRFAIANRVSVISTLMTTCSALFQFFWMFSQAFKRRNPLSLEQFNNWRRLKQGQA